MFFVFRIMILIFSFGVFDFSFAAPDQNQFSFEIDEIPAIYNADVHEDEKVSSPIGLSIDGGGIRGLIPAIWLEELESLYEDSQECSFGAENSLYQVFDLVGGTSIGGILSLGVEAGLNVRDLKDMLNDPQQAAHIFPRSFHSFSSFFSTVKNGWGFLGNKYSPIPLKNLLEQKFGEKTLSDLRTSVLVTSCLKEGMPVTFEAFPNNNNSTRLVDISLCTSAGPTYFPEHRLEGKDHIDGGVWMNNPSPLIASRLFKECQRRHVDTNSFKLLSLGTGNSPDITISPGGRLANASTTISAMFQASSSGNIHFMENVFSGQMYRVNTLMNRDISLDDVSESTLNELREYAFNTDCYNTLSNFVNETSPLVRDKLEKIG